MTLQTVFCQTGQDEEQVKFREALLRLHTYSTTYEDYILFSTHFWNNLTPTLRAKFDYVLHLLPTRASVLEFNCWKLVAVVNLYCIVMPNIVIQRLKRSNLMMQKD